MTLLGQPKIFDDFYRDPDAIRSLALDGDWFESGEAFLGLQCNPRGLDVPDILNHISALMGEVLRYHPPLQSIFRLLTAGQEVRKTKHVHVDRAGLAALVCLNPEARGATLLLRHRDHEIAHLDDIVHVAHAIGAKPAEVETVIEQDSCDLSKWDVVNRLEYRYNRLIVFDSNHFHVAGEGFGADPSNAKLTQNFNFFRELTISWRQRIFMRGRTRILMRNPY